MLVIGYWLFSILAIENEFFELAEHVNDFDEVFFFGRVKLRANAII